MLVPAVYETATDILNAARVRLNDRIDTLVGLTGQVLDSTQPWTQQAFNTAYRKFQDKLVALGFMRLEAEAILENFPALVSLDPSVLCWINWAQNWNGTSLAALPVLPATFMAPLEIWERQAGTEDPFMQMDQQVTSGIPTIPKKDFMLLWQWRDDKLFFPGARVQTDLRMRFLSYLPDLVDDDAARLNWYEQRIPILRCLDPLTDYLCREFCIARGDADGAAMFQSSAEAGTAMMTGRDTENAAAILKASEYGKMRDTRTPA